MGCIGVIDGIPIPIIIPSEEPDKICNADEACEILYDENNPVYQFVATLTGNYPEFPSYRRFQMPKKSTFKHLYMTTNRYFGWTLHNSHEFSNFSIDPDDKGLTGPSIFRNPSSPKLDKYFVNPGDSCNYYYYLCGYISKTSQRFCVQIRLEKIMTAWPNNQYPKLIDSVDSTGSRYNYVQRKRKRSPCNTIV